MFPVAHAHCILITKFAHSFIFMIYIFKNIKVQRKHATKWFFDLDMEDISSVYLLNQIFWYLL